GLAAGAADTDRELMDELVGEVLDARLGEVLESSVSAHEAGGGDDVDTGLLGDRLVVVDVAAVADAGGIHEGLPAVVGELAQLRDGLLVALLGRLPPAGVELTPGHS